MLVLLISCENNVENRLSLDISFNEIYKRYSKDVDELKLLNFNLLKETNDGSLEETNELVMDYFNFLDSIQKLCINTHNPFFYKGERSETTELGIDFIQKTDDFLMELNKNIKNQSLKKRALILLNVDNIPYDDEWIIIYLDYHFRDIDCEVFNFLLENRKRNVLLIQNEMLYLAFLEQCNSSG